jgi:hypothetical protein
VADKLTTKLVVTTQSITSQLEDISDLDKLPLEDCMNVTCPLLTSIYSPQSGCPPVGSPEKRYPICARILRGGEALRLAFWDADGVRERKLHLWHCPTPPRFDKFLLNETFLNVGNAFRLANYVCHSKTDHYGGVVQTYSSAVVYSTTQCPIRT